MLNQYLADPRVPGVCLHNTSQWQVTELMGGLAVELLYKKRAVSPDEARRQGYSLHDSYPSVFMQGDEANEFLEELRLAQEKLDAKRVDSLLLNAYSHVMQ